MRSDNVISQRYLNGDYAAQNPTWDSEDAPWKVRLIADLLRASALAPGSVAEIGCGSGAVLAGLRSHLPEAALCGFDISPDAARFWPRHGAARIEFTTGDFLQLSRPRYDLILLIDVVEHVTDPHGFLTAIRERGAHFVFHFPLDLSASSVVRESPLLESRARVGHIHYFTKGLALALLRECGFEVVHAQYTGAAYSAPQRTLKTRLAALPRRIVYALGKDWGVRLLGGETLLVLARPRAGAS
jgi:SAM-dependent methyltransferase